METFMEKIQGILKNYSKEDAKLVHDTIDELCAKGIGKGCYQDYGVLNDIISVISAFENAVSHKEDEN